MGKRKKNVLFVLAHMDDEAFSYGTIKKLRKEGHKVLLLTVCGAGRYEQYLNHDNRKEAYIKMEDSSDIITERLEYNDLSLDALDVIESNKIKNKIEHMIRMHSIEIVYTNNFGDLHQDHKAVSQWVRLVCRKDRTSVEKLYECYIPGSTEAGEGTYGFNTYVDISEFINEKSIILNNYGEEIKGCASTHQAISGNDYYGTLSNFRYSEIFKLVFERID